MTLASAIKAGDELNVGADVFQPSSSSVARCLCGCNGVKLVLHDRQGVVRAVAGYSMEAWLTVNRADDEGVLGRLVSREA